MTPAVRPAQLPAPRDWHYFLMLVAFGIFAVYGSLVPLKFTPLEWDVAVERFQHISWLELGVVHRADWVANILLFVPLGFLGMATCEVDRRVGLRTVLVVLVSLALWSSLSLAIEFTQLWFPPRTVSLNDLIAESIGALLGIVGWFICGQRLTDWLRRVMTETVGEGLAALLLPGYLVFLMITHWMPLDLSISPGELYDKYRGGRILLVPFTPPHGSLGEMAYKYASNLGYFVPLGVLWAQLSLARWPRGQSLALAAAVGLAVSLAIELGQVLVLTRFTDVTDVLTGTAAVVGGWWATRRWRGETQGRSAGPGPSAGPAGSGVAWRQLAFWLALLTLWLGVIVWFFWAPFEFRLEPKRVAARLENLSLIPFFDYYRQSEFKSFDNVLRRIVVFLPVGVGLGMAWRAVSSRASIYWPFPVAVALVGVIEVAQFFLPDKTPSVTDGLLGCCGAWLGLYAVGRVRPVGSPSPAPAPDHAQPR